MVVGCWSPGFWCKPAILSIGQKGQREQLSTLRLGLQAEAAASKADPDHAPKLWIEFPYGRNLAPAISVRKRAGKRCR